MNTETGMVYQEETVFNDVFWENDFIYFLVDQFGYIGFYRFDLTNNIFIQESFGLRKEEDRKENVFTQYYNCLWYK